MDVGVGAFTNGSLVYGRDAGAAPPSVGGEMALGGRFVPWLSAGLRFDFQLLDSHDVQASHIALMTGAYVRLYPFATTSGRRFEPWVSLGFDYYVRTSLRFDTTDGHYEEHVTGFAVPISVGMDFNFVPGFGIGPRFTLTPWLPSEACATTPAVYDACTSSGLAGNVYWFLGLGARFTIPVVSR